MANKWPANRCMYSRMSSPLEYQEQMNQQNTRFEEDAAARKKQIESLRQALDEVKVALDASEDARKL